MSTTTQVRTYQARLKGISPTQSALLDQYALLFNKVEHNLFADSIECKNVGKLKPAYCAKYNITARQYNSVAYNLKGKIASIHELKTLHKTELKARIAKAEKVIKKTKHKFKLHHKKRRLVAMKTKLAKLENTDKVSMCFGSKKLFKAQFHLKENKYESHSDWLEDWTKARSNQFTVIGSKDETSGNQSCVITTLSDKLFQFKLRLPNGFKDKHITFQAEFNYGSFEILETLMYKQAITYRFLKDAKGWRIFISISKQPTEHITKSYLGALGVDINVDHLAVSELDRYGNFVKAHRIALCTYGLSSNQAKAAISEAVKELTQLSKATQKPIVIEKLDFKKKKTELEGTSKRYARMLSSFAYKQTISSIRTKAFDAGIEIIEVNPAFTSIIGRYKFMTRYGISSHQSAALAIGRRAYGYSEKPNPKLSDHVTFSLPVRNREKHVWSYWGKVIKEVAHAGHIKSMLMRRSTTPPVENDGPCDATNLYIIGENPMHESSSLLFG